MVGFPHYAQQVWETIKKNSDLNLPSQKEMLATYRCDEISATAFNTFSTAIQPIKKKVRSRSASALSCVCLTVSAVWSAGGGCICRRLWCHCLCSSQDR